MIINHIMIINDCKSNTRGIVLHNRFLRSSIDILWHVDRIFYIKLKINRKHNVGTCAVNCDRSLSTYCRTCYPNYSACTTSPTRVHTYLTLILLRLFQQHYCYNVTGQSQESEGSCKPARIKEVHSNLHSFQASLCTLTATHLTLIYVCTYIRLSVPLGCLIKQAGIIIHTILNMWETPGIEPATSDLTSVYQISSSTK